MNQTCPTNPVDTYVCHPPLSDSTNHRTTYDMKPDLQYSQLKAAVRQTQKKAL